MGVLLRVAGVTRVLFPWPDNEQCVHVVFCDIVDFSDIVDVRSPPMVVELLDRLWSLFDAIVAKHGVTKMETVGKTYMASVGMASVDPPSVSASKAVWVALDMMQTLAEQKQFPGVPQICCRIGVHSGPAMSGVVGRKKPQFSLIGDTVNSASRMQSCGITGRVNISPDTYKLVSNEFTLTAREVTVKSKGRMTTYLVDDHANMDRVPEYAFSLAVAPR